MKRNDVEVVPPKFSSCLPRPFLHHRGMLRHHRAISGRNLFSFLSLPGLMAVCILVALSGAAEDKITPTPKQNSNAPSNPGDTAIRKSWDSWADVAAKEARCASR